MKQIPSLLSQRLAVLVVAACSVCVFLPATAQAAKENAPRIESFVASPATLPLAGGPVHLRAHARYASQCLFSGHLATSKHSLTGLPTDKKCANGKASIKVNLPANTGKQARIYKFALTITSGKHKVTHHLSVTEAAQALTAPVITLQPQSQTVQAFSPGLVFTASASGNPTPSVQWQFSGDGGSTWTNTSPTTQPVTTTSTGAYTLYPFIPPSTPNASENGWEYRAVFTNSVSSVASTPATLTVAPQSTTSYSGYMSYASPEGAFTAVSASWTVPTATCPPTGNTFAVQWPGIGDGLDVEQDGTATDCSNGTPYYYAWVEMYGDPDADNGEAIVLPPADAIAPGDAMTGSVAIANLTWTLALSDATRNWNYSISFPQLTPALSQASAEWMLEDPGGNCSSTSCPLTPAQISGFSFTNASATYNGVTGPISEFSPVQQQMAWGSTLWDSTSVLGAGGSSFSETYTG